MSIRDDPFATFRLLQKALGARGFSMETLQDKPMVVSYYDNSGRRWTTRADKIAYPLNGEDVRALSINKERAYEFAEANGFPVPYSRMVVVDEAIPEEEADELFGRFGRLIVKPADASLGRGLTLDIRAYDALEAAIEAAHEVSPKVLVQQQVEGEEVRFVAVNGRVGAALLRQTPRVIGDGALSVAELIAEENHVRRQLRSEYVPYPQLDAELVGEHMTSGYVPQKGEVVELNRSTMIRGGASIYNVLPEVHQSYVRAVEALVKKTGAGFIVADVFCQDYTVPATQTNYQFIEFNTAPVLKLCYACRDGRNYDILSPLADAIAARLTEVKD